MTPRWILLTSTCETPKRAAMSTWRSMPRAARIAAASASDKRAMGCRSPRRTDSGVVTDPCLHPRGTRCGIVRLPWRSPVAFPWRAARPFAAMSAMFSAWLPRNKWSGLQHGGLSQRWSTNSPGGMGPRASVHATRCAPCCRASQPTTPYPVGSLQPVQSRHPLSFGGATLAQNFSGVFFLMPINITTQCESRNP